MAFRIRARDMQEYRRIALWILFFMIVPAVSIGSIGILILAFSRQTVDIVLGVLVLSFVAALAAGVTVTMLHLRRRAQEHTLQRDFVSKVSHELRTPLTSIRMFIETLQLGRLDDNPQERQEALAFMASETARLTGMINRLLDWGRIEAGKRIYVMRRFPVERLSEQALASLEAARKLHDFDVSVEVASGFPELWADLDALTEALSDLLHNAVKYTGVEKRIVLRAWYDERFLYFAVSDNGIGISQREHRAVFEKFYRIYDPVLRDIEGSGLGLAMVKRIVEAHHGRVMLDSELGKGSTFTIRLPRRRHEYRSEYEQATRLAD